MKIKNKLTILVLSIALILPLFAQAQDRQLTRDGDAQTQKRVALVIGNGDYAIARKLVNPMNDASDMAKTLRDVGFEVISGTNLNLKQMTDKVREFGDKLKASGGVGLFYYAGHGVQVNNRNYLIPVEADITREDEIDFSALNFDQVLRKMATANNGLNIVILDACRNNPFARSWSRGEEEGGLAQISAPTGTFIAYATSPDKTASDGTGRNGLYTAELLKFIKQPNMRIEETFKEVRKAVNKASNGKQIHWDSSSLSGDFYFSNSSIMKTIESQKTTPTRKEPTQESKTSVTNNLPDDEVFWDAVKDTNDRMNFVQFIESFPKSKYVAQAQKRLDDLDNQQGDTPGSNSSIKVTSLNVVKIDKNNTHILIFVELNGIADVKVFVNGLDITSKITKQLTNYIELKGKYNDMNLRIGNNEAYIIVNGIKSNIFFFKQFEEK